jgi:hypothetical protein
MADDSMAEVMLARESDLQRLYLGIQPTLFHRPTGARYNPRARTAEAKVPSLLL